MPTDSYMEVKDANQATKRIDGENSDDATPEFRQAYVQRVGGTLTDRSGSITLGGSAQQIAAANAARRYLLIQNISTTALWVNIGATAVQDQPSITLQACAAAGDGSGGVLTFEGSFVPTALVSIIGPTTGAKFVAKEG